MQHPSSKIPLLLQADASNWSQPAIVSRLCFSWRSNLCLRSLQVFALEMILFHRNSLRADSLPLAIAFKKEVNASHRTG
jgi:hypothetical protein